MKTISLISSISIIATTIFFMVVGLMDALGNLPN